MHCPLCLVLLLQYSCLSMPSPGCSLDWHPKTTLECVLHAVMKEACLRAEAAFRGGSAALDAVVAAITVLEVSPSTFGPN